MKAGLKCPFDVVYKEHQISPVKQEEERSTYKADGHSHHSSNSIGCSDLEKAYAVSVGTIVANSTGEEHILPRFVTPRILPKVHAAVAPTPGKVYRNVAVYEFMNLSIEPSRDEDVADRFGNELDNPVDLSISSPLPDIQESGSWVDIGQIHHWRGRDECLGAHL